MFDLPQVNKFKKKGYIFLPGFLNKEQVNKLIVSFNNKKKREKEKSSYSEIDDELIWDFLCNKDLKEKLLSLIGPELYFLHDTNLLYGDFLDGGSWHRDNPCRKTGFGPDWDQKKKYNVITVALYLSDSDETGSALNVIPKSHTLQYKKTLSNLIRNFHNKTRYLKNFKFIRNICEKFIGHEIKYKPGDLILFYSNLYHTGSTCDKSRDKAYREVILSLFGGSGDHSKNYINYELNYRKGNERYLASSRKELFFKRLKENNIFISPEVKKEEIKGIFMPKNQLKDGVNK